jgi:serine/threonine protein phosphatase PrpC
MPWQEALTECLRRSFDSVEASWTQLSRSLRASGTGGLRPYPGMSPAAAASANGARSASSGACLTAVAILGGVISVANVGDAKCVLRRADGTVEVLTEDHRCCNEQERRRILALGGIIRNNRVQGVLEPTRTIGDTLDKEKAPAGVISATPATASTVLEPGDCATAAALDTVIFRLNQTANDPRDAGIINPGASGGSRTPGSPYVVATQQQPLRPGLFLVRRLPHALDMLAHGNGGRHSMQAAIPLSLEEAAATAPKLPIAFVLVCSDGVWDVLSVAGACDVVAYALAVHRNPQTAAAELIRLAQRKGSKDDITVAVAWLTADAA